MEIVTTVPTHAKRPRETPGAPFAVLIFQSTEWNASNRTCSPHFAQEEPIQFHRVMSYNISSAFSLHQELLQWSAEDADIREALLRKKKLTGIVFIAPCGALNSIERARSSNVTLKWARDEDRYCAYFCSSEKILAGTVLHICVAESNYEPTTPL